MLDDHEQGRSLAPPAEEQAPRGEERGRPATPQVKQNTVSAAESTTSGQQPGAKGATGSKASRRLALGVVVLLALGSAAYYGHYWWTQGRYLVGTDDAYVGARYATLSPKISGYLVAIEVDDNAPVKTGDVIARIDDGDYRLAVQSAQDQVAIQEATVARLGKQAVAQQAGVDQARAQLVSAKAGALRADLELKRQQDLASRQINSAQQLETAKANADQSVASVQAAVASVEAAVANVDVLKAQQEEAVRTLRQLKTALAKAERDLSFTVIRAPFDGVVGNRAVQVGDYVQPTQRLASLVPLGAVYVDANFKETQVARLKPGQPVSITVDALPGKDIEGRVDSVAPASGSVFSLLPPDNATGNFTKIVQRLPVRILVPIEIADEAILRPGMSVVVSVNTKPGAPVASQHFTSARGISTN